MGSSKRKIREFLKKIYPLFWLYNAFRIPGRVRKMDMQMQLFHDIVIETLHHQFAHILAHIQNLQEVTQQTQDRINILYKTIEPYFGSMNTIIPEAITSKGVINIDNYLASVEENLTDDELDYISSCSFEDKFYFVIAKLFRGSEEHLHSMFDNYIDAVKKAVSITGCDNIIDIGCGKGDWMQYLRKHGITNTVGVDINTASAHFSIKAGFDVEIDDAVDFLKKQQDDSASVITLLALAEHLTHEKLKAIITNAARVIAKGGVLIMDAPNPFCYFNMGGYYIDPSHISWVSPEATKLLLEMAGFSNVYFKYFAPSSEPGTWLAKSSRIIDNYQVVGIIAEKGVDCYC